MRNYLFLLIAASVAAIPASFSSGVAASRTGAVAWIPTGSLQFRPGIVQRIEARSATCKLRAKILDDNNAAAFKEVIPATKDILIAVQRADFIVHLNLCPFAKEPMKKGTIRFAISTAENGDELRNDVFQECARLLDTPEEEVATSLMMAPAWKESEQKWGEVGYWLEDFLEEEVDEIFDGKMGVVFFHPEWTFDELPKDDPTHYERRAPFPTVSFLRKSDIKMHVTEAMVVASHKQACIELATALPAQLILFGNQERGINLSKEISDHNTKILKSEGTAALAKLLSTFRSA